MATKPDRYKKLPALKGKKVAGTRSTKVPKLTDAEIAEGQAASEQIAKRPTKDFSREELSALMQTAPGGAEQNQIRTRGRQFNRAMREIPETMGTDERYGPRKPKAPMSAKTPKIDEND